jgi:hypothetical protein
MKEIKGYLTDWKFVVAVFAVAAITFTAWNMFAAPWLSAKIGKDVSV